MLLKNYAKKDYCLNSSATVGSDNSFNFFNSYTCEHNLIKNVANEKNIIRLLIDGGNNSFFCPGGKTDGRCQQGYRQYSG